MKITLTIPDDQARQLEYLAHHQDHSVDSLLAEFLREIIRQKLADSQQLSKLVAETRALVNNPHNLRPAQGSLLEALQNSPPEPELDLEIWTDQCLTVEAEMNVIDQANDRTEGLL